MNSELIAPNDGTDSAEQTADNWVPISVESLRYATDQGFDLYIRDTNGKAPFRLYRGHDVPVTDKDIDQLLSRRVFTLYTSASKARAYRDFLRERVLSDGSLPLTRRYEVLTSAARVVFEEAFQKRDVNALCTATDELADQLIDVVNYEDVRLFDLVEVMLHDYSTFAHATRVCSYSLMLAQGMGIKDRETLAHIAEGALLHDVGKLFVSDSIVEKNYRVTPQERELMRAHPAQGFRRLAARGEIQWGTLMMVYQHHERADGCGFPVGLEVEEIHPWARICAVANTYDSMMRDVPIRDPQALKKVYENLTLMSGRALDEEMTEMLAEDLHEQSAADLIDSLPCLVKLPEKLEETFELAGSTPSMPDENRRFPRVRCRSVKHRAGLRYSETFATLERHESWSAVYLADFSKSGIQIIHSEQLYPGERMRVILRTGNLLELEVVRCRRLGEKCYSIGAQIVKQED